MEGRSSCVELKSYGLVQKRASEGKIDGDSKRLHVSQLRTFQDFEEYYGRKFTYSESEARALVARSLGLSPSFGRKNEREEDDSDGVLDITKGVMTGYSYVAVEESRKRSDMRFRNMRNSLNCFNARIALEFFEKSQDAEFEIVEVLYSEQSLLAAPGANLRPSRWCHVCFVAKPKNADRGDASPKYFFGELLEDNQSQKFNAKYCSTFELSDDPGFNHGCVLCPADQKFHPSIDGYAIGHPPWYVVKILYR